MIATVQPTSGILRDVADYIDANGVWDALDAIIDVDGRVRKRGGTNRYQTSLSTYNPTQIIHFASTESDGARALYGCSAYGPGLVGSVTRHDISGAYGFPVGGTSVVAIGRPWSIGNAVVFPGYDPTAGIRGMIALTGSPFNRTTNIEALGVATLAVTAGSSTIVYDLADLPKMLVGRWIGVAKGGAGNAAYLGRIQSVINNTTVRVSPTPTLTITGAASGFVRDYADGLSATNALPRPIVTSVGCGCAFQNRSVVGNCGRLNTTNFETVADMIAWTVLPTEIITDSVLGFYTGNLQTTVDGISPLNTLRIPELQVIRGLSPVGPSRLLALGPNRSYMVTGSLTTINDSNQSLPIDVAPVSETVGLLTERSLLETPYGTVWAARDGVYSYNGSELKNAMRGSVQTLWNTLQNTPGFTIYGAALVRGDHYVLSTSAGGLVWNMAQGENGWTRHTINPFTGAAIDRADPTKVYVTHLYDPIVAPSTSGTDRIFRIDGVTTPSPANAADHDGDYVEAVIQSKAFALRSPAGLKRIRRVNSVLDLKDLANNPSGNLFTQNVDASQTVYLPNSHVTTQSYDHWYSIGVGNNPLAASTTQARASGYSIRVGPTLAVNSGVGYYVPNVENDNDSTYVVEVWVYNTTAGTVTASYNGISATTTAVNTWTQLLICTTPGAAIPGQSIIQIFHSAAGATFYVTDLDYGPLQPVQARGIGGLVAGCTINRDTTNARTAFSPAGFKCSTSTSGAGIAYYAPQLTLYANQTYTFSVWLKLLSGNNQFSISVGSSVTTSLATINMPGVWQKYTYTYTPAATAAGAVIAIARIPGSAATWVASDFAMTGPAPECSVAAWGGLEAEGDYGDGLVRDTTFTNYAQDYEEILAPGTISATGGQLVPLDATLKIIANRRCANAWTRDGEATLAFTPGHAGDRFVLCLDMQPGMTSNTATHNYLFYELQVTGPSLNIRKVVAGVITSLNGIAPPAINLGVTYWLRAVRRGNRLDVELWTADPELGGTPGSNLRVDISPADAALFPAGRFGLRWTPGDTVCRIEEFRAKPYGNIGVLGSDLSNPNGTMSSLSLLTRAVTINYTQIGASGEFETGPNVIDFDTLAPGRTR